MTNLNYLPEQLLAATHENATASSHKESSSSAPISSTEHTPMLSHSFLTYYSRHQYPVLSPNEQAIRQLILDFKEGKDYACNLAEHYVINFLRAHFTDEELENLYFTPVPAATMDRSCDRWCIFTHEVCRELHTFNGYDEWCNLDDVTPSHITRGESGEDNGERARNYFFTKDIKGQRIIVFDDIVTSGASIDTFCKALEEEGAEVVAVLTLAATKA